MTYVFHDGALWQDLNRNGRWCWLNPDTARNLLTVYERACRTQDYFTERAKELVAELSAAIAQYDGQPLQLTDEDIEAALAEQRMEQFV